MDSKDLYSGLYETVKRLYAANDNEPPVLKWNRYQLQRSQFSPLERITGKRETYLLVCASYDGTSVKSSDTGSYKSGEKFASHKDSSAADDELDLTGCPLECSVNLNESIFQLSPSIKSAPGSLTSLEKSLMYRPLNMEDAWAAHTAFAKISKSSMLNDCVAVLCDGADREGTRVIGLKKTESTSETFRVTCKDEVYPIDKFPPFDRLKRKHLMGFPANHSIRTSASAKYVILDGQGELLSDVSLNGSPTKSTMRLECEWKKVRQLVEVPTDAACTVHFDVHFGDDEAVALSKWKEIMALKNLIDGIDMTNGTRTERDDESVLNKLTELLENSKWSSEKKSATASQNKDHGKEYGLDVLITEARKNMDFSDSLWNVLKECGSRETLCSCFTKIFEVMQTDDLKIVISNRNSTRLAKMIVDLRKKGTEVPTVSCALAAKLLIEAGIEKLKQDYVNIFLASGLVTKDAIKPFIDVTDSADWTEHYVGLVKLHCVVELILLCNKRLQAPPILLSSYARTALNGLATAPPLTDSYKLSLPIDFKSSFQFLVPTSTDNWTLKMDSTQDSYSKSTICLITRDHPLMPSRNTGPYIIQSPVNAKGYHLCVATSVKYSNEH